MEGGYIGKSMSVRAKKAYDGGERPLSKWTRADIIDALEYEYEGLDFEPLITMDEVKTLPVYILKSEFLTNSSWHHTGAFYQCTDFYSIDVRGFQNSLDEYQYYIERRKARLAATRDARRKERAEVEARRAVKREAKALAARVQSVLYLTKYKTHTGLLNAVNAGRVDLEALEAQHAAREMARHIQRIKSWVKVESWDKIEHDYHLTRDQALKAIERGTI